MAGNHQTGNRKSAIIEIKGKNFNMERQASEIHYAIYE